MVILMCLGCVAKEEKVCKTDADCEAGEVCIEGKCVTPQVDTTPLDTILTFYPAEVTNSKTAEFEFTCNEQNCTFECLLDSGSWKTCSSPKTYTGLSEGSHVFHVRAIDSAGNIDLTPAGYTWTIDTTPPDTTIISHPPNLSNSTFAVFEFTCNEQFCTFECQLDNGGWLPCMSPKIYTGLSEGPHTFYVRAMDSAGNIEPSPGNYSWSIGCPLVLWSHTTEWIVDSSPSIVDINNDGKLEVVIGSWDGKLYVLHGEDGSLLWAYTTAGDVSSSPALGDIDNDGKLEVVVGSAWGDNNIYALNGEDGSLLWKYLTGGPVFSSPSLGDIDNDGKLEVVVGSFDGKIYALDGENGSLLWSYVTENSVHASSPSLGDIDNDGKLEVVVGSWDHKLYALNGEDGSVLWFYATGGWVWSSPALGDIDNDEKLEVVVGSGDGNVYALNGEDGSILWNYTTGGAVDSSPALADIDNDGKLEVVVGSYDNNVYALNGEDGSLLWFYKTGGGMESPPTIGDIDNDGRLEVIIGAEDNNIYALNGEDGSLLWFYTTEGWVQSSPALGDINNDGKLEVVAGSFDGRVYAISTCVSVPSPSLLPWPELGNRGYNRTRNYDSWEMNDFITRPANIIELVRNGAIPGYIWKSGDVDYYSFLVTQPGVIKIDLKDIPSGTNYDLYLYDPTMTLIASSTNSGNFPEAITYSASATGTYFIRVDSSHGYSNTNPYSLYIKEE